MESNKPNSLLSKMTKEELQRYLDVGGLRHEDVLGLYVNYEALQKELEQAKGEVANLILKSEGAIKLLKEMAGYSVADHLKLFKLQTENDRLRAALELACELLPVAERNQDAEWYRKQDEVYAALKPQALAGKVSKEE